MQLEELKNQIAALNSQQKVYTEALPAIGRKLETERYRICCQNNKFYAVMAEAKCKWKAIGILLDKLKNIIGNKIKEARQHESNKEEEAPVKLRTKADDTDKKGEASNDQSQGMGSLVQKQNTSRVAQSSAGQTKRPAK